MCDETAMLLLIIGFALCLYVPHLKTLTRIQRGIEYMADAQAQALADLEAAVAGIADAVTAVTTALSAKLAAATSVQPDDSVAIEAEVAKLNALAAALKAAAAPAVVADAAPAA